MDKITLDSRLGGTGEKMLSANPWILRQSVFLYSPLNYMTFEHQDVTGKVYKITTLPDFMHFLFTECEVWKNNV